jgi:diguanylate cyclase (GGDEF)-like protein
VVKQAIRIPLTIRQLFLRRYWGKLLYMLKQRPAAKLFTIVGLLLIPIAVLGYLYLSIINKDIATTTKERQGVAMLEALAPVFSKLSSENSQPTSSEIAVLEEAGTKLAKKLDVTPAFYKLLAALKKGASGHDDALTLSQKLIVQVGDTSNLILDPDLDSYYLMDAVVLRIPELIQLSNDLSGHKEGHSHDVVMAEAGIHQKLTVEQFSASLDTFKTAMRKASDNNKSKVFRPDVLKQANDYAVFANDYAVSFLKIDAATRQRLEESGEINRRNRNFVERSLTIWKAAASNLDEMLQYRVNQLRSDAMLAGSATAIITLLAIGLAFTLLTRIVGKLDDHIVYLAHYDPMTKAKNRAAFSTELTTEMQGIADKTKPFALHLVDVDNFKTVNDTMGHQWGDAVLIGIANRLSSVCRPEDVLGRFGGDEFVVMQRCITEEWQAKSFADRLVTALREPLQIENNPYRASVSIGSALAPLHGDDVEKIMHSADLALYAAKAAGRDRACFYSESLNKEMLERQQLEKEVRTALEENRFFLNFQAQYSSTGKSLRGFEALLRLRTTSGQTVSPLQFIPLVEQMGLIDDVGAWVLEKAAMTAANWPDQVSLAVNISPLQLQSGKLCDAIRHALRVSGIKPSRLEVEITENILLDDNKAILHQLEEIKAMGVSIALDDFGAGYSSLSYLWRFPFNKLKIDRSFMKAFEADRNQAENILRTIVMLGHSLQMTVTAEGVETNAQASFLNGVNCDEIQGFLYAKPVPEQDLAAVLIRAFQDEIEVRELISILAPDNTKLIGKLYSSSSKAG